ncbi:unnamed protein product [Bursaphelenchus okinawaensis]|uniref:Acyltransferase n=1 Tax=Bursaphelenchus okinawaensis TaxID=465554 RepID=A0A811LCH0_9BILA|nr:unnamed protein product [Bursaphelenchus okinawaensis]CAG9120572.1 unnamed protein product [Bursaphelenchus okinawaensis]
MGLKLESRWERRIQTGTVMKYMFIFLIMPFLSLAIVGYMLFYTQFWWTMGFYFVWLYYDWNVGETGGRPNSWYRRLYIWKAMADYFPNEVIMTSKIPNDKNYIFGWHPHGIISVSAFNNFCTNGTGLDEKMPGIQRYMASLSSQFYYPFRREIVTALGVVSSSREGLSAVLNRKGGGNAVGLVIGGAEEAMESHPDVFALNLKNRKGFIKLALRTGSSLVPVYTFGETGIFKQLNNKKGTPLRDYQSLFKKRVGVSPVLFYGAGMLKDTFGMLPFRQKMITIIGPPLHVDQVEEPTQQQIDDLHAIYVKKVHQLFDDNKHVYNVPKHVKLNIY